MFTKIASIKFYFKNSKNTKSFRFYQSLWGDSFCEVWTINGRYLSGSKKSWKVQNVQNIQKNIFSWILPWSKRQMFSKKVFTWTEGHHLLSMWKLFFQKELKTRPSTECFRIVIFTRICVYAEGAPKLLFHASIYRGTQSLYRGDGRSNVAVNCRYSDRLVVSLRYRPLPLTLNWVYILYHENNVNKRPLNRPPCLLIPLLSLASIPSLWPIKTYKLHLCLFYSLLFITALGLAFSSNLRPVYIEAFWHSGTPYFIGHLI